MSRQHRHGIGWGGGLEADTEEHHLPVGQLGGQLDRVQGAVDHPNVAALTLDAEQVL